MLLSGNWVGIPLVESTPRQWRTYNNLLEQGKFFADRCGFGHLRVGSRRHPGQAISLRLASDALARWPSNPVREILCKAEVRGPLWSTCVQDVNRRHVERDKLRTRFRQQIKKLDGTPRVLRACIRCRHTYRGI